MAVKKAVFFSIMSLFIVILFVASTELASEFFIKESELDVTRTRVKLLNSHIHDFENSYFDKMIYVSAKNSLIGLSKYYDHVDYDLTVIKDMDERLAEVIYEGKIIDDYGNVIDLVNMGFIDEKYTLNYFTDELKDVYDKLGLEIEYLAVNFSADSVTMADPWTLQLDADIDYYFIDNTNIASWKGSTNRIVNISVIGLYMRDKMGDEGIITKEWKEDKPPYEETSVLRKLEGKSSPHLFGLCKDYC